MSSDFSKTDKQKAFEMLYTKYYERLCYFLLSYTSNKAIVEDIVQDTFVKLWANWEKISDVSSYRSYLYKSAYNTFINHYREKKKRDKILESYYQTSLLKIINTDEAAKDAQLKKLEACIEKLPPKCKKVFLLNKISGMTYKEVASRLGISVKTVEGHITKAFILLKECMN